MLKMLTNIDTWYQMVTNVNKQAEAGVVPSSRFVKLRLS